MPRQGMRKKQRERAQAAKKVKKTELKETQGAPQSPKAVESRAADMEAVLAKGEANEKLFELANRPKVAINVAGSSLEVVQDRSTQEHSGGVVWETALFLLRYLERRVLPGLRAASKPRVVELGSGCGLLGLGLARLGCQVTLTDQLCALPNLQSNVEAAGTTAKVQALSWEIPVMWLLCAAKALWIWWLAPMWSLPCDSWSHCCKPLKPCCRAKLLGVAGFVCKGATRMLMPYSCRRRPKPSL